jgi:hypothetical protein
LINLSQLISSKALTFRPKLHIFPSSLFPKDKVNSTTKISSSKAGCSGHTCNPSTWEAEQEDSRAARVMKRLCLYKTNNTWAAKIRRIVVEGQPKETV